MVIGVLAVVVALFPPGIEVIVLQVARGVRGRRPLTDMFEGSGDQLVEERPVWLESWVISPDPKGVYLRFECFLGFRQARGLGVKLIAHGGRLLLDSDLY